MVIDNSVNVVARLTAHIKWPAPSMQVQSQIIKVTLESVYDKLMIK